MRHAAKPTGENRMNAQSCSLQKKAHSTSSHSWCRIIATKMFQLHPARDNHHPVEVTVLVPYLRRSEPDTLACLPTLRYGYNHVRPRVHEQQGNRYGGWPANQTRKPTCEGKGFPLMTSRWCDCTAAGSAGLARAQAVLKWPSVLSVQ